MSYQNVSITPAPMWQGNHFTLTVQQFEQINQVAPAQDGESVQIEFAHNRHETYIFRLVKGSSDQLDFYHVLPANSSVLSKLDCLHIFSRTEERMRVDRFSKDIQKQFNQYVAKPSCDSKKPENIATRTILIHSILTDEQIKKFYPQSQYELPIIGNSDSANI
ncbi:hypothetical protein D5018_00190 [Parashewanella curva]|uniref:Uncharacterized protein n=1 Tax=Parashewanella curva TaxID=2338552 RepID=A0A3L8Q3C8_9GAMM|nr:hypothetical protein [Parashewanella curva]RLV61573.1 hypothetical protein D5018_00190 [Parashewanella curva]